MSLWVYSLPHGAKCIDSDDFAIEFRGDKIVFAAKATGGGGQNPLSASIFLKAWNKLQMIRPAARVYLACSVDANKL